MTDETRMQAKPAEAAEDPTWDTKWTSANVKVEPEEGESENERIARIVYFTKTMLAEMPAEEGRFVIEQMAESEAKRLYGFGWKAHDIVGYVRYILTKVDYAMSDTALRRLVTRSAVQEAGSSHDSAFLLTVPAYVRRLKEEVAGWDEADKFGFGIDELDNSFGRLLPGELLVLVGAQGSMKTSLMLSGVEHYLQNNPNGTAMLFSLDMAPEVVAERLLQREMYMTAERVRWHARRETEQFKDAVTRMRRKFSDRLLIYGSEPPGSQLLGKCERMTIEDVRREVEAYMPSLVAIDYLTLLRKPRQSDLDCVNEAMPTLKEMAQRYGIMFLLLSQMGRASKQLQASGSALVGSAKGGGIVEELSGAQIDLFKDAPIEPYGAPRIIATVSKTRRGVAGRSFELAYDGEPMSFTGRAKPVRREREQKPIFKSGLF